MGYNGEPASATDGEEEHERIRVFEAVNERWDPLANDGSSVSSYGRTDVWAFDVAKVTAKWVKHKRRQA